MVGYSAGGVGGGWWGVDTWALLAIGNCVGSSPPSSSSLEQLQQALWHLCVCEGGRD